MVSIVCRHFLKMEGLRSYSGTCSNMDTSTVAPRPVRSRRKSADWIAYRAYIPVAMSDTGTPVLAAASGVPVIEHSPDSACTSMS